MEIVTLRLRRLGHSIDLSLPAVAPVRDASPRSVSLHDASGQVREAPALPRGALVGAAPFAGPLLLIDPEATTYVPPRWVARGRDDGTVILERG